MERNVTDDKRTISVWFQTEHNFVMPETNEPGVPGNIPIASRPGQKYLVRVRELEERYPFTDLIIEYSIPNLRNMQYSGRFT
jgi:hypothetical protein